MLIRFSLAALFALLVAISRPVASGGDHDLLAVGVRWEEEFVGRRVVRLSVVAPTRAALAAHRAILKTSAREALLQGSTVFTPPPADAAGKGPRILEMVYYGVRSRAGRAPVLFGETPGEVPAALAAAHEAARDIAALPPSVTEAGARVLLGSPDDLAFRDALEALLDVRADAASAAALAAIRSAGPGSASPSRRLLAVQALRRLGGAATYPEEFRRLRESDDPDIREAATR